MRIAVVDIGTNSTRLAISDVVDGRVQELHRDSQVTRLGQGVDASGALADEAMERVHAVLGDYLGEIERHEADARIGVLTSAVRDASNGPDFQRAVNERYGIDARVIPGEEEAQLTFLGATSERSEPTGGGAVLVIDIGGGSTELVVGRGAEVRFFRSLQAGVVRMAERHLHDDPPSREQLDALRGDVRSIIDAEIPDDVRDGVEEVVAVAGTATQAAAIDLALEPYDPDRVHGHRMGASRLADVLAALASLPEQERMQIIGLDPKRAPTIVPGIALLLEVLETFGADGVEVSEHDILRGAALRHARENG
jgi:exopolyphosphatase / guanosine-5'-triphosphate,3'-diphosphate pyrophosphatase